MAKNKNKKNYLGTAIGLVLLAVLLFFWYLLDDLVGAVISLTVLVLVFSLFAAVVWYFISNFPYWVRYWRGMSTEDYHLQLERKGKAVRENYVSMQALTFDDLRTSILVHLIDIGDGKLLCLYDQYYYEFEPIDDDPELNQPRKFPTRSFTLLRDLRNNKILALYPGGEVFEPVEIHTMKQADRVLDFIKPVDGEILEIKFKKVLDLIKD